MNTSHFPAEKSAAEILTQIIYVTVATASSSGSPWNSPLYCAFDRELNFFWTSTKNAQHSRNIRENSSVFLVVYDSTAPNKTGRGVYFEATATELTAKRDIAYARHYTQSRIGAEPDDGSRFVGDSPRSVYKAIPKRAWINDLLIDAGGQTIGDVRKELDIEKIRHFLVSAAWLRTESAIGNG